MSESSPTPDVEALKNASDVVGLVNALDPEVDWHTRDAAAAALSEVGDDRAVGPLINHLGGDTGYQAAETLANIGTERAVDALFASLDVPFTQMGARPSRDQAAAVAAAHGLGKIAPAGSIERLVAAVEDESAAEHTRIRSAGVLAAMERPESTAFLGKALCDPRLRGLVVQGMKNANMRRCDSALAQPLIALLADADWHVRGSAVSVLGLVDDPKVVEPLIGCLKDGVYDVRRRAVLELARRGDTRAIAPIKRAAAKEPQMGRWMLEQLKAFPEASPEQMGGAVPKPRQNPWWRFWG
jgi:HEAT repeat protein